MPFTYTEYILQASPKMDHIAEGDRPKYDWGHIVDIKLNDLVLTKDECDSILQYALKLVNSRVDGFVNISTRIAESKNETKAEAEEAKDV